MRNRKMVWQHRSICWYFHLNLKYLGWSCREYIKTATNGSFCDEFLSGNNFEAILVNFCFLYYGTNAFETVQKISTRTLNLYANSLKK